MVKLALIALAVACSGPEGSPGKRGVAGTKAPRLHQTTLYVRRKPEAPHCRIFSATLAGDGSLLLFAGLRLGSAHDFGREQDLVYWRSTDAGATFTTMKTLLHVPRRDVHTGPVVVDRRRNRILKFCRYWPVGGGAAAQKKMRNITYARQVEEGLVDHVLTSDDHGRTWSLPQKVILPYPPGAHYAATGNGVHGIQLADGRLLIQAGYATAPGGRRETWHCCVFWSGDGGRTWKLGATTNVGSIREFTMAQLNDARVYCNFRNPRGDTGRRLVSWTADPAKTFGDIRPDAHLPGPAVHAGLFHLPHCDPTRGPLTIFTCQPLGNRNGQPYNGATRKRITVRLSPDGGKTWPHARDLPGKLTGYSDVVATPRGVIHCIYESGPGPAGRTYHEKVTYVRFPASWVLAGGNAQH